MFTNAQVIAESRALRAEIASLRAEVARLNAPTGAPAAPIASAPIVSALADPAPAKVALLCAGHGREGANVACAREFRKVESLAAHNAWAHR